MKSLIAAVLIGMVLVNAVGVPPAAAQVPRTISYQGLLLSDVDGSPVDGMFTLRFSLYGDVGTSEPLWTEEHTAVEITGGILEAVLGESVPLDLSFDGPYWLGITIGNDPELTPRIALGATPYSFAAGGVAGETNVFPSDGNVGIGTGGIAGKIEAVAKLDVEGDLRIGVVSESSLSDRILVHGENEIVHHVSPATLAEALRAQGLTDGLSCWDLDGNGSVNPGEDANGDGQVSAEDCKGEKGDKGDPGGQGAQGPAGPVGPTGPKGDPGVGLEPGEGVEVRSADGELMHALYPDGSSFHKGTDTFGGIEVYDPQAPPLTPPVVELKSNGPSTFAGGIEILDESGEPVITLGPDGSYHDVPEVYAAGISIDDGTFENDPIELRSDGSSSFGGEATFRDGARVEDGLEIIDSSGETVTTFTPDGETDNPDVKSRHKGTEVFERIVVEDLEQLPVIELSFEEAILNLELIAQDIVRIISEQGTPVFEVDPSKSPTADFPTEVTGNMRVNGVVQATGITAQTKAFKIDHPLDPANRYLYHTSVESPDMTNLYTGNATLGVAGEAWVELPAWFEALNKDFRYQLTCIGGFAPVYVADEIRDNRFKIAGGAAGMKVSWQVTGVRHDPYAEAYRAPVEMDKQPHERGTYSHPELYGYLNKAVPANR